MSEYRNGDRVRTDARLTDDLGASTERGTRGRVLNESSRSADGVECHVVRWDDGSVSEVPKGALRRSK